MSNAKIVPTEFSNIDGDAIPKLFVDSNSVKHNASLRYNRDQVAVKAPRLTFKGHENAVLSVALLEIPSSNELLVVSGSEDKSVIVWSMKTGALLNRLRGHTQRVVAVTTFMNDSIEPIAISGSWDECIRIWPLKYAMRNDPNCESATASECKVLKGHTNRITSIRAFTLQSGDSVIISGSTDASIRVWSIVTGQYLYNIFNANMVTWVLSLVVFRCKENGDVVVRGGKDSLMRMWAIKEPHSEDAAEPIKTITGSPSRVSSISAYSTDNDTLLVTLCRDFIIRVWSVKRGELVRKLVGHSNTVTDLTLCHWALHNTAVVVSSSSNGNLRVWLLATGELLRVFNGHSDETSAVVCFPTKSETNDIIIVSGSVDKTLRSWLFAEETSLTVLQHGVSADGHKIRINSMDVYNVGEDVLIFTAGEDGCARAFSLSYRDHSQSLLWCKKISKSRLGAVCVYTPVSGAVYPQLDSVDRTVELTTPLAIFSGRDKKIRILEVFSGEQVGPVLEGHTGVVTSLFVHNGSRASYLPGKTSREAITPFLLSGSEDNTMKMWCIAEAKCLFTCQGHAFDVTAVCSYVSEPFKHSGQKSHADAALIAESQSARISADGSITNRSVVSRAQFNELGPPILLTGSLDNTIRLWTHRTGELIAELRDSPAPINSLATIDLAFGPVVAGGGGNGAVRIWSLQEPYLLLHTLVGHTDEVQAVQMFNAEGLYPVLVSASWDMTLKVWSLNTFKNIRTIEGHSAEITAVAVFAPGGTDPAVASSSTDTTVRIAFDFLGSVPKVDYIRQSFQFDLDNVNSHVVSVVTEEEEDDLEENRWPRTSKLVSDIGAVSFFTHYYFLFFEAVEHHRSDFVAKFLPLSTVALVKSNNTKKHPMGSLLHLAITVNEVLSVYVIVSCWIKFLTSAPTEEHDLFYNRWARISMDDMILLAEQFPKEFERIVCAVDLQPISAVETVAIGTHYLSTASDGTVFLGSVGAHTESENFLQKDKHRKICFFSLPLINMAHMEMLKAMVEASLTLDSVSIFDSDAGQMALGFAWRKFGKRTHIVAMVLYFAYVAIAATSIYSFKYIKSDPLFWPVSLVLIIMQLTLDAYFIYVEFFQLILAPVEYVSDIWNQIDLVIIVGGLVGNIVRLIEWDETNASRILLSITSVFMWFNTLFYLRAFEATGPLVSMIVRIATDMRALMFVVLVVLVGFSQAFWLISNESEHSPFANIDDSLVVSFVFMLGGYDTSGFEDLPQPMRSYGLFLSAVYMMIVSILLLNLLIALMGDSFGEVKEKGLAQWRLEQAQLIIENAASMSKADRECTDQIYFRKYADDRSDDVFVHVNTVDSQLAAIRRRQDKIEKLIESVLERLPVASAPVR